MSSAIRNNLQPLHKRNQSYYSPLAKKSQRSSIWRYHSSYCQIWVRIRVSIWSKYKSQIYLGSFRTTTRLVAEKGKILEDGGKKRVKTFLVKKKHDDSVIAAVGREGRLRDTPSGSSLKEVNSHGWAGWARPWQLWACAWVPNMLGRKNAALQNDWPSRWRASVKYPALVCLLSKSWLL